MIHIKKSSSKGRRYQIELENGEKLRLPQEVVFRHSIFTDYEFSARQWDEILHEAQLEECFAQVVSMINRRAHTQGEIFRKLYKKKFDKAVIIHTLDRAEEIGLTNDAQFAKMFVEEKLELGLLGRRRIEADLNRRGVDRRLIDEAFDAYASENSQEDAEWLGICRVAERKWKGLAREEDPMKRRKKLLSFLAGRGFTADLCYRALERVTGHCEPD